MEIYSLYGPALLRKCERMLSNRFDAEDIVQSLFLELLKKGKTEVDLPFLYRATTNRCLNLIRNKKKQRQLLSQHGETMQQNSRTRQDEPAVNKDLLIKLVAQLDKKSSEIMVYRFFDDMTQDEIAELMGVSRKTVGKRIKKIRTLVEALAALGEIEQ